MEINVVTVHWAVKKNATVNHTVTRAKDIPIKYVCDIFWLGSEFLKSYYTPWQCVKVTESRAWPKKGILQPLIFLPMRPRLNFKLKLCLTEEEGQRPTPCISLSKEICD